MRKSTLIMSELKVIDQIQQKKITQSQKQVDNDI